MVLLLWFLKTFNVATLHFLLLLFTHSPNCLNTVLAHSLNTVLVYSLSGHSIGSRQNGSSVYTNPTDGDDVRADIPPHNDNKQYECLHNLLTRRTSLGWKLQSWMQMASAMRLRQVLPPVSLGEVKGVWLRAAVRVMLVGGAP